VFFTVTVEVPLCPCTISTTESHFDICRYFGEEVEVEDVVEADEDEPPDELLDESSLDEESAISAVKEMFTAEEENHLLAGVASVAAVHALASFTGITFQET
jgi:hypothetical protein